MTPNIHNTHDLSAKTQDVYDHFNGFVFSKDRDVFNKLYARIAFYKMTSHLIGDIVECGVFKGSGLMTWLKILSLNEPSTIKKVIGFDYFDPSFVESIPDSKDKKSMREVFSRCNILKGELSVDSVLGRIRNSGIDISRVDLVDGDITKTSASYVNDRPGFRISILYMDVDLYKPTYDSLNNLWDRVVPGGLVVFDEHGYHAWSESSAVDQFVRERGVILKRTDMKAPTAYIVKGGS
jgi:hypothetical protein